MKMHCLKPTTMPKVTVLAAGLMAALMVTAVGPLPAAQALPSVSSTISAASALTAVLSVNGSTGATAVANVMQEVNFDWEAP